MDGFPHEEEGCFGSSRVVHAVECGCLSSVCWMIDKGVSLQPQTADGYPPLIAYIEGDGKEKYRILEVLIASGADIIEQGINGWTPLHMAALRDDERPMRILLVAGADRTTTTRS